MKTVPYFVGITGGSGSGKTYFLRQLMRKLPHNQVCFISQDHYYKPCSQIDKDKNGVVNYDLPNSIDYDALYHDLKALQSGKMVHRLEYTFNNPDITPKMLTFLPVSVIVLEGLFVFYSDKIRKLINLSLFVETNEHICVKRRIVRDYQERGYDLDDVLYRFEYHTMPTYQRYVEPMKTSMDFVIPNNQNSDQAQDVIVTFLKQKIHDS